MIFKNIYENLKNKRGQRGYNRGVSLIELLVVIGIFMIISSMTIFSYNDFRSSVSIQNLADDIGLSVRKAQSYAIGVVGSSGTFGYNYGINFSVAPITSNPIGSKDTKDNPIFGTSKAVNSSNKSFILFIDRDKSNSYTEDPILDCNSQEDERCLEYLEILSISSQDEISRINLDIGGKTTTLKGDDQIDLLFKRPTPEPVFCYRKNNGTSCDKDSKKISSIMIMISSEKDSSISKTVTISNNGQISVDF